MEHVAIKVLPEALANVVVQNWFEDLKRLVPVP
jgi:hypothetical protein